MHRVKKVRHYASIDWQDVDLLGSSGAAGSGSTTPAAVLALLAQEGPVLRLLGLEIKHGLLQLADGLHLPALRGGPEEGRRLEFGTSAPTLLQLITQVSLLLLEFRLFDAAVDAAVHRAAAATGAEQIPPGC
ncbi:hypothetical protein D9Q98_010062 [Chlorella vulgaris]|uniref:Uncharacterized protein n=1 Tax=Chlorella vulgaris TaxID=3077 RepID=A0A9D4TMS0_CHLVU|nr:hypothetical protein D9Q98_010062 [Chlorella vulgaris]